MNELLRELYEETILDHYKRPRNASPLAEANRKGEGFNPLCGDHIQMNLYVEGDTIKDIGYSAQGCAICTASASMMSQAVKGHSVKEALALFDNFQAAVTGQPYDEAKLGELEILAGVKDHPVRIKCAILAWHTLKQAVESNSEGTVSTE